jgi:Zn-dependent peptidase ImmA (M78 family)
MAAHRQAPVDLICTYQAADLERIATQIHRDNEDTFCIPVDVDLILENMHGIDLDIYPCLEDNYGLAGMTGIDLDRPGMIFVYVDENLANRSSSKNFYRSTLAEELAHIILHRQAIENVCTPDDFLKLQRHPNWYKCERNAKRLAAAILMPASHLIDDAAKIYSESFPKLRDYFDCGQKTTRDAAIDRITSHLADHYGVSTKTMGIRLKEWPINVRDRLDFSLQNGLEFLADRNEE